MNSSYNEARMLEQKILTVLQDKKHEMVDSVQKTVKEDNKNSIARDPLTTASYIYGILQSFDTVEELVKHICEEEMANLINENREFDWTMTEYKQLKEVYGKQKDCARCIHRGTALAYEPCSICMSCMTEYKPKYKEIE